MNWFARISRRLRAFFQRRQLEADMDEEIQLHLELKKQANLKVGMSPSEARAAALRDFGWTESIKEQCRDICRPRFVENLLQDIRFGVRMLFKNLGFTGMAVLTLAVGIGATTAILSVLNRVLLHPLPFGDSVHIVHLGEFSSANDHFGLLSPRLFLDLHERAKCFTDLEAMEFASFNLRGGEFPELIQGFNVSARFFDTLEVKPLLGRTFTLEEGQAGHDGVVVLGFGLWQRRFGGDTNVLGRTISINDSPCTVVGVMPRDFMFFGTVEQCELWHPYMPQGAAIDENPETGNRTWRYLVVFGRLKPGLAMGQAQAELAVLRKKLQQDYSKWYPSDWKLQIQLLRSFFVDPSVSKSLLVLAGGILCVLFIACANVANLLLARAAMRQKEMAVRLALGAGWRRLLSQLLTESVLLSVVGGAFGSVLARLGTDILQQFVPRSLPGAQGPELHAGILGLSLSISTFIGIGFGLVPALRTLRTDVTNDLKDSGPTSGSGVDRSRFRNALVGTQVALTVVLLSGAGLMIHSIILLIHVDPGLNPRNVMTFQLELPMGRYRNSGQVQQFYTQAADRIGHLPGVAAVAISSSGFGTAFIAEGQLNPVSISIQEVSTADHDYLGAMQIPLLRGRHFSPEDTHGDGNTIIINEALAQRLWPRQDPVGRRLRPWATDSSGKALELPWLTVIGVMKNARLWSYSQEVSPAICQILNRPDGPIPFQVDFSVRTTGEPLVLAKAIRREIASLDPNLPVSGFQKLETAMAQADSGRRLYMILLTVFGAFGVLLSAVGIYGVLAYFVSQRRYEIGIRMALGAERTTVVWLVLRQGLTCTAVGFMVGISGALALTRLLTSQLFGVKPTDPMTMASAFVLLVAVVLLACLVPARRAASVDPMAALRYE